jgi:iron-sulfur cluster assembly protein
MTMFSIPGLKVISLTEAAAARVRAIAERAEDGAIGLRVGVKKGGCAGMEYTFDVAKDIRPGDEVVEEKGAKVVVDAKAVMFLIGTELDFRSEKLNATFVFNNPNQTSACGCGESVAITPKSVDASASGEPAHS